MREWFAERLEAILPRIFWATSVPITWIGLKTAVDGITTILGLLTAFLGFSIGVCGLVWWIRRLKRQDRKIAAESKSKFRWRPPGEEDSDT